MDKGRAGRGKTEHDRTNTGSYRMRDGTRGRNDRPVRHLSLFNFIYSPLLLILLTSSCFFSTEYDDRRDGIGRDQRGRDDVSFAPSLRSWGRERVCVPVFLSSIFLFASSLLLTVLTIQLFLFFAMINNRQFGVGPDMTDEVGDRNAHGTRRGGEATGTCHIIFCCLFY